MPGGGAQAEYVAVAEDALARVPDGWSLEEAATLPMNGLTVRNALDLLALPPGSTLAVTGSAGIVGQFAIQLGRHEGLTVIGDAAPAEIELIESFGADRVVPRGEGTEPELREIYPDGVDAVLDAALLGPEVIGAVRDGGQLLAVRPYAGPAENGKAERDIAVHLVSSASTCTRATASPSWPTWSPRACSRCGSPRSCRPTTRPRRTGGWRRAASAAAWC